MWSTVVAVVTAAEVSPGVGLGEPWDSLIKASGATVILVLIGLWTKRLYLPGTVDDRDKAIAELKAQIESVKTDAHNQIEEQRIEAQQRLAEAQARTEQYRAETREMTQWLQKEAIPLVARNLDLIKTLSEQAASRL